MFLSVNEEVQRLDTLSMQATLMTLFIQDIAEEGKGRITYGTSASNACAWRDVSCVDGIVTEYGVWYEDIGNYNLHVLPPSIRRVCIVHCAQRYELNLRRFPRCITTINLNANEIFGPIDLEALPANLEELKLHNNRISGTISMWNLPESLQELNLRNNAIDQKVLRIPEVYHDLRITLQGMEIERVLLVDTNGVERDYPRRVLVMKGNAESALRE